MIETTGLFSPGEWMFVILTFVWSGLVRTGIGFGGAALALPILLLIRPAPLLWLPVIATHLLFFSSITIARRLDNVDWAYLRYSMKFITIPKLLGVLGLVVLPPIVLVLIVYAIILAFALSNIFNYKLSGRGRWSESIFLILGGYVSGTSLVGAPLIVVAYSLRVQIRQLRDTLFVLWIILVCIKITSLWVLNIPLQWQLTLLTLPGAAIGHVVGLRVHDYLISRDDVLFRRYLGIGLAIVSVVGLANVLVN